MTLPLGVSAPDGLPRVIPAGRFFAPEGRYFPRMHTPVAGEQLVAEVVKEIDDGAQWVKLIGDFPATDELGVIAGSETETTYSVEVFTAVINAAHDRGVRVAVHTNSSVVSSLVALGIDSVEHGISLTAQDIERLAARGGAWTPTLCATVGIAPGESEAAESDTTRERRQARSRRLTELLAVAARSGLHVLAGSDVVGTVADEVALLVSHGLPVEDALRAASTDAHEYLDTARADDVVTYDHDPREDPAVLKTPAAVVIRGTRVV